MRPTPGIRPCRCHNRSGAHRCCFAIDDGGESGLGSRTTWTRYGPVSPQRTAPHKGDGAAKGHNTCSIPVFTDGDTKKRRGQCHTLRRWEPLTSCRRFPTADKLLPETMYHSALSDFSSSHVLTGTLKVSRHQPLSRHTPCGAFASTDAGTAGTIT